MAISTVSGLLAFATTIFISVLLSFNSYLDSALVCRLIAEISPAY